MKRIILFICLFSIQLSAIKAQVKLDYYLNNTNYNSSVPKPSEILGFEVGDWHIRHEQLVRYMYELARTSDRVTIQEYGRTYERRPLLALTITSPENHSNLEAIKKAHQDLSDPTKKATVDSSMPVVIYMGFSVHGNEPSGANSSLLVAYRLAASNEPEILDQLKNAVIIFDPSFNPDGLDRFAFWANTNRGMNIVADPQSREHNEYWPYGRTNHYWFDLNRDWLPVQHVEMVGRIKLFHEWKPNVLTDHHEMGTNSTFFFQPGIPSRTNPITPQKNQDLTAKIGEYHAKAFDSRNALYYSQEDYDDFYYGKGSTYPDVNGSIGILFEQASSRGHSQESVNGELKFPFTIKNQFEAAFSTLKAGTEMRTEILTYQQEFYTNAVNEAKKSSIKGYLFGDEFDQYRTRALVNLLEHHKIEVKTLTKDATLDRKKFSSNKAFFVPTEQTQYRLVRAIFETMTSFKDSLFYDISSWTMPLAFNLPYAEVNSKEASRLSTSSLDNAPKLMGSVVKSSKTVAYAFELNEYLSHRALFQLQSKGLRVKVSEKPFFAYVSGVLKEFAIGSIVIPIGNQEFSEATVTKIVQEVAASNFITIYGIDTGSTPKGGDIGSSVNNALRKPSVLLVSGAGVNSNDAGEIWHLLDTRFDIPTVLMDADRIGNADLSKYNVILMVGGSYSNLGKNGEEALSMWLRDGGTIVAMTDAVRFMASSGLAPIKFERSAGIDTNGSKPYSDYSQLRGAQVIGGAIFEAEIDRTHPLAYGISTNTIPVFRDHTIFMNLAKNSFANPFRYTSKPLLSGYISKPNLKKLGNTAAVSVYSKGRGKVIALLDNPNFRAFWYGPNKILLNAIFFSNTISSGTTQR